MKLTYASHLNLDHWDISVDRFHPPIGQATSALFTAVLDQRPTFANTYHQRVHELYLKLTNYRHTPHKFNRHTRALTAAIATAHGLLHIRRLALIGRKLRQRAFHITRAFDPCTATALPNTSASSTQLQFDLVFECTRLQLHALSTRSSTYFKYLLIGKVSTSMRARLPTPAAIARIAENITDYTRSLTTCFSGCRVCQEQHRRL